MFFKKDICYVFRQLVKDEVFVFYIDDLIILSHDKQENIDTLQLVLKTAVEEGFYFNFMKCQFLKYEMDFLSYNISNRCLCPSSAQTKAILYFPETTSLKDVQSLLGLTGYLRKLSNGEYIIAKSLSYLLKHNFKFIFGPDERADFTQ